LPGKVRRPLFVSRLKPEKIKFTLPATRKHH
jgi:hypothetical protein